MTDSVGKLHVEDHWVGIVGLDGILETVKGLSIEDESLLRRALLEETRKRNYVPPVAEQRYMDALLRAYRRFRGEAVDEPAVRCLVVEVVGRGCPSCDALERTVLQSLSELGLPADFRHVRDAKEAAKHGSVSTPALIVGGVVKSEGRVPPGSEIRALLKDAVKDFEENDHAE
ncbi:MAG: thioredoxin family protein [Planctomycetota bacterium]|jgi:small redox-active disulfide protein 2